MSILIDFVVFVGRPILGLAALYLVVRVVSAAYFLSKQQFKGPGK